MKNYYDILQVSPNAEQEVIDAAYRRLARKYHPDVYSGRDAADRMRELNEAHEVLGDPDKRAEYDAVLGRTRSRAGAAGPQGRGAPPPPPPPPPDPSPPPKEEARYAGRTAEPIPDLPLPDLLARGLTQVKNLGFGLLFLWPSILLFAAFVFYPLIKSVYLGFYESDPLGNQGDFVGFDQYRSVLGGSDFRHSLWITFQFTVYTVVPGIALGLGLAMLANQKLPGISIFRTIFASTVATSVAVASMMWLTLLNPTTGLVTWILDQFGQPRLNLLNDPDWALPAVSLTTIWLNLGLATIVFLAGLQSIPERLYESARIDGASRLGTFLHVTLPMLSPTLLFVTVIGMILAFESFGQIHILTRGGPLDATNVIVYSIYTEAFQSFNYGVAAVQAVGLFILVLGLTALQLRFLERRVFYQ